MKLPLSRVAEFVSGHGDFDHHALAQGYSIDSRTVNPGELFFAVKGERLDGHDFVEKALERGAIAAIVQKDHVSRYRTKKNLIVVGDTLSSLQKLATAVRRLWAKPVIGITGSVGKTTTKDAIAHVLSSRNHVLKSEGNFNNHFGLPLMLLRLEQGHDLAVIEMGMSHMGEIKALAHIAQPDTGVVTSVAPVHLEFFDSLAGIARAKYELIESLPARGTAILNADDEYVSQFGRDFRGKVVLYGTSASADVRAEKIECMGALGSSFDVVVGSCRETAQVSLIGKHNVSNALAAVAVALQYGFSPSEAVAALGSLVPADKRGEVTQVGDITVVNDCYNSNPKALDTMVDVLATMPAQRRIVVAGEMLELGLSSDELHRRSGHHMAERGIDMVIGVRGSAKRIVEAARKQGVAAEYVETPEEAGEWLAREARQGDVVLFKASRGVKLERALETFKARRTKAAGTQN
jgi:UDP-N-acetylmuramoyl-tripeptide--D-alanyl-D-alanine ligase